MRLGMLCFTGSGHLYPAVALGRRLALRGHEVTVFHPPAARALVAAAGLQFRVFSEADGPKPAGTPPLPGPALRRLAPVFDVYERRARSVLAHGRDVIANAALDGLIVDQADFAGSTVAESLAVPFVTIGITPPVWPDPDVPPTYFSWRDRRGLAALWRNRAGNALVRAALRPTLSLINAERCRRAMPPLHDLVDTLSPRGVILQLPSAFDFPRRAQRPRLFYAGPFVDGESRRRVSFRWDRLDGRPVVYASLGTIRNDRHSVFRMIAAACSGLDVQLVLSLGGGGLMPEDLGPLPGDPIVVHFAPQLQILNRAALTVTHAGVNTVLESLGAGVPLVAIPQADDQPGVASRLCESGAGTAVRSSRISPVSLRAAIARVLNTPSYRDAAERLKREIAAIPGAARGADIIEAVLGDDGSVEGHGLSA